MSNDTKEVYVMCPCCGEGEAAPYGDVDRSETLVCNYCGEEDTLQAFIDMAEKYRAK